MFSSASVDTNSEKPQYSPPPDRHNPPEAQDCIHSLTTISNTLTNIEPRDSFLHRSVAMNFSSSLPAGNQQAPFSEANHHDLEDEDEAYIIAWSSPLINFTTGYVRTIVEYFNLSGNISKAAVLSYIHRRNKITAQYHPQPTKMGWTASVPPRGTPAWVAYWAPWFSGEAVR